MLKPSLNIPIIIVLHRNNYTNESLAQVLAAKTFLQVKEADEKEIPVAGNVYIAPPDYHLLFEKDYSLSLDDTEKVRFSRPSIDVSFQSAAGVFKTSLVGILLSGSNADGSDGIAEIKQQGGLTIIQDPTDAMFDQMPLQALKKAPVDKILSAVEIAEFLNHLNEPV